MSFIFNNESRSYIRALVGFNRPAWAPIEHELLEVPGKAGAYTTQKKTQVRVINIPVEVKAINPFNLQQTKEDLAKWLITDGPAPLQFADEPNRTYFAEVTGEFNPDEILDRGKGVITFICTNPYKYAPETSINLNLASDPLIINNKGHVEVKPKFIFNVTKNLTAIEYATDYDYMAIGQSESVDKPTYSPRTTLIADEMTTTTGWGTVSIQPDDGARAGTMLSTGDSFYATNYGAGTGWHGPMLQRSFTPCNDYEVKSTFTVRAKNSKQRSRAELYLIGTDNTIIGKLSVRIPTSNMKPTVMVDLRNGVQRKEIFSQTSTQPTTTGFYGRITLTKKGTTFTVKLEYQRQKEGGGKETTSTVTKTYNDISVGYQKQLAVVAAHVSTYASNELPQYARVRAAYVYRLNEDAQNGTPYIAFPGDVVEIDHEKEIIIINDEPRTDLKDFGANYFTLKPGNQALTIGPLDSFTANVSFREGFK